MKKFFKGFRYALEGLAYAIRTQRNMQFHIFAAIIVLILASLFTITTFEWLLVLSAIALVFTAELFNTAIESLVDLVTKEKLPLAKAAKDTAAAAVLVCAMWALGIGIYVFGKYILKFLSF